MPRSSNSPDAAARGDDSKVRENDKHIVDGMPERTRPVSDAASTPSWWPPRNRRDIIRAARGAYEAHMEQMLLAYPRRG